MIRGMTRTRPLAVATSLTIVLAGATALLPQQIAVAGPRTPTATAAGSALAGSAPLAAQGDGGANTYFSAPPDPLAAKAPAHRSDKRPKPPPTKGTVTGRVTGPQGTPIANALVTGIRFSDLGLPVDVTEEKRVLARTDRSGAFTLKQLREPYLIRVCSESVSSGGGGHRAVRSGECDQESSKRFTPSYLGPDGNLNSWMRHTRFFRPQAHRSLGRVVVQPPAVLTGTWKADGANRLLKLTRVDGSVAATTLTDSKGGFRVEVAPGPYRLEADRDEGLHTDSTVPGYRSKRLLLRAGRTVHDSFKTRHAGIVRGLVTSGGVPLPDQFLAILDKDGDFAAGVVTNEIGRYVVSSLEPGAYTVTTSYAGSAYVPKSQIVAVSQKTVAVADLALDPGRSVAFSAADVVYPGANGSVDAELRNADGRVVKVFQGNTGALPGGVAVFTGLPIGTYSLYVRRSAVPSDGPEQVDFPWTAAAVDLVANTTVTLPLLLSQPTTNLTGTLPAGGQVKLTAIPEDSWLRPSHVDGDQATPLALNWTVQSNGGAYVVRGIVPGIYSAAVTTARKERGDKPSTTGANLAATHSTVLVDGPAPVAAFTAPKGAKVRGLLRYARGHRPVIAPFGFRVFGPGDRSWLFPTVSDKQKYGKPFRVEMLHAGKAAGRLLDLEDLYAEHPDVLIPDNLVSSARNEVGTPYWFTARKQGITLTEGGTVDVGVVELKIHGVNGVRAVLGGGGKAG
jgi:protocatechuate 3,4-dioxygenase beta subunit